MKLLIVSAPFKKRFFEEMLKFMNVEVQILPIQLFYQKYGYMFPAKKPWDMMSEFEPDVVLTDLIHYPQFYTRLYSKINRKRTRLLTHLRGNFWMETDYYFKSMFKKEFWMMEGNKFKKIVGIPSFYFHFIFLANRAIRLSDKILPICKWLEGEVRKNLPGILTEVMYQGVNPDMFYEDVPLEWEHPAVGILQNHSIYPKTKGLIDFHRVIERLPHVHFYIAGGDTWGMGYFGLVKEALGKYPNVHFMREVQYPEGVRRFLNSCDVYVLASGLDCCPTTLLEASLCRKPVLGSRVGGIPEIVDEGKTGWTIPNENVDEWVEKINLLLEDRRLAHRMGEAGRKYVEGNFSWKVIASQLEGMLKS